MNIVGEDALLFASDYPHERRRGEFESDIDMLIAREDITDRQKEKILYRSAERFYTGK